MADKNSNLKNPYDVELPQSVIESFARFLLPEIRKFYAGEEGQRVLKEWQKRKEKDNA